MDSFTISLNDVQASDIAQVGGKGANLGELIRAGFNVPPGFCVTTHAFAQFMGTVKHDIYRDLASVSAQDIAGVRRVGENVRNTLKATPLPTAVEDAVVKMWLQQGKDKAYAVRSSATAEDLPTASFAGQQDTYLNVSSQATLVASVKACFISLFTDRAILYRIQNGFDHREVSLAVVVQQMVQSDVSGILFTANPITGNRHIASIDASFGLGEALVSGLVSADLYQVDTRLQQIIKRQIASKQVAIHALPDGGTEQITLGDHERDLAALDDSQVMTLARIGKQIEAHYAKPQDIEWAYKDGKFYITQARPITSLFPLPQPQIKSDKIRIYFSISHAQVMTDAMPPLSLSFLRTILPAGHITDSLESDFLATAGGRLYADVTLVLQHPLGRRIILRGLNFGDQLAASAINHIIKQPDFLSWRNPLPPRRLITFFIPLALKTVRTVLWGKPEGRTDKVLHYIDTLVTDTQASVDALPNPQAKIAFLIPKMQQVFSQMLTWAPSLAAGIAATAILKSLLKKTANPSDLAAVERGLPGNVVTDMNLAVGDLADIARGYEALLTHLRQKHIDAKTRLADAATLPNGGSFLAAWENFIQRYGTRGPSEIDISRLRWAEDPSSLLQMVLNATEHIDKGAHRTHYQRLAAENEAAATRLIEVAGKGWLGWLRGRIIRRLLRVSRNLVPLREHHKFLMVRMFGILKSVLIEFGAELVEQGQLDAAEDIWFLTFPEVLGVEDNADINLKALVASRRSQFIHAQTLTAPHVITSEGEIPSTKLDTTHAPEGALIGSPVSAGIVEGIAKVIRDPNTEMLEPGEILVAPFTDPGWTPLFVNAAGLVTEVGGLMTHGSLVAREYGIPAVVGVLDATQHIKTGQRLRVHGDAGYVEILADSGDADSQT